MHGVDHRPAHDYARIRTHTELRAKSSRRPLKWEPVTSILLERNLCGILVCRFLLAILVSGVWFAIDMHSVGACICRDIPSAEEALAYNDRVFSGRVVKTYDLDLPAEHNHMSFERRVIIYEF